MNRLKFITCSGVNEFTDIGQMLELADKYPMVEFGIQVSALKCSCDTPRYWWIKAIQNELFKHKRKLNLALHINQSWVENLCQGILEPEVFELLHLTDIDDEPLFKRIQLNFRIGRDKTPNFEALIQVMQEYSAEGRRFILSYNSANADFIDKIYAFGIRFDCLFDTSYGEGILPSSREKPAFDDFAILQGYAGGFSPDNVIDELLKIEQVMPQNREFFIDAEGRLKNSDGVVCLSKCEQYLKKALQWQRIL